MLGADAEVRPACRQTRRCCPAVLPLAQRRPCWPVVPLPHSARPLPSIFDAPTTLPARRFFQICIVQVQAVLPMAAEFAAPMWVFGQR